MIAYGNTSVVWFPINPAKDSLVVQLITMQLGLLLRKLP